MESETVKWLQNENNQLKASRAHEKIGTNLNRTKSAERAEEFRDDGNQLNTTCCKPQDFYNVYPFYSKAIAYAPANSKKLTFAYSNLSSLLFQLGKYSECLQAIDNCLNLGYPEDGKFAVFLRKIECLNIIDEVEKAQETYQETQDWIERNQKNSKQKTDMKMRLEKRYKKEIQVRKPFTDEEIDKIWKRFSIKTYNSELPGTSSAISLKYSDSQGRHFEAEKDILAGEVLMQERPYIVVCSIDSRYQCCWECLKTMTNCIPCDHCENVIFCSDECKEKAWMEYHQLECEILPYFLNSESPLDFVNRMISAFRVLLIAIREFGSFQKLKENFRRLKQSTGIRTKGFTDEQLLAEKYIGFINLKTNPEVIKNMSYPEATALIYHVAKNTNLLGKRVNIDWADLYKDDDVVFATSLFVKHLDILRANEFTVSRDRPWTAKTRIASLSIPASFFNHSCVPNAFIFHTKEYIKVVAISPIKKGQQVLVNYLGDTDFELDDKQRYFQLKYIFTCNCLACTKDWPVQKKSFDVNKLQESMSTIYSTYQKYFELVNTMDTKHGQDSERFCRQPMRILKELSESLKKLHANTQQPCIEVLWFQEYLIQFGMKLHSAFM